MRTHGGLTESSRTYSLTAPIGKGREGNRKGREVGHPSIVSLDRACEWMAADAARIGGGW